MKRSTEPKESRAREINDDTLQVLIDVLPTIVELKKVDEGIEVRPVNQPALANLIEMSADVRDKVVNWFLKPRRFEKREEWEEIRGPALRVWLNAVAIIMQSPVHRQVFLE